MFCSTEAFSNFTNRKKVEVKNEEQINDLKLASTKKKLLLCFLCWNQSLVFFIRNFFLPSIFFLSFTAVNFTHSSAYTSRISCQKSVPFFNLLFFFVWFFQSLVKEMILSKYKNGRTKWTCSTNSKCLHFFSIWSPIENEKVCL